jgi:hypothetical protein
LKLLLASGTARSPATAAALQFNLAVVCEAAGDLDAAGEHYDAARRLAPNEPRFRFEKEMFLRRYGLKPAVPPPAVKHRGTSRS